MPTLEDLKGKEIIVCLVRRILEQGDQVLVTKLVSVESSGIWIEGRNLAKYLHDDLKHSILPRMPLFFVPFAQVRWIFDSADYPSLSEKGLGL
jgi:hypothetical protein